MEPSREDLLELLVRGEGGMLGGARRRKKPVPPGLKKWHAFQKKHPELSRTQQSRLYQKQKKKKGRGFEEFEEEEEFEGFGMLGGAKSKHPKASSSAWKTKTVRGNKKLIKMGEKIYNLFKSTYPKEHGLLKKQAIGSGVDFEDYMTFVANQRKTNPDTVGVALRKAWDETVEKGRAEYYSEYERVLMSIAEGALDVLKAGSPAEIKNRFYLLETGEVRDPPFADP